MRRIPFYLSLILALAGLVGLSPGCSRESSLEPSEKLCRAEKIKVLRVRDYADHHNKEVQRLILLDHNTKSLSQNILDEYENLALEMDLRNPEMAAGINRVQASLKLLPALNALHRRGHPPLDIFSLLQQCLAEFSIKREANNEILKGLDSATHLLLARNNHQLNTCLMGLQKLADNAGSPNEKCIVGVFLGSWERMLEINSEKWYGPWIVLYDFIGSLVGGSNIGSIYSGWAELMFMEWPLGEP